MSTKQKIFDEHMARARSLHKKIQEIYTQVFEDHEASCIRPGHNDCMFNTDDPRLHEIVMCEREIIVIRRKLKRDIKLFEKNKKVKAQRLAIIAEIEKIEPRILSNRPEYVDL